MSTARWTLLPLRRLRPRAGPKATFRRAGMHPAIDDSGGRLGHAAAAQADQLAQIGDDGGKDTRRQQRVCS